MLGSRGYIQRVAKGRGRLRGILLPTLASCDYGSLQPLGPLGGVLSCAKAICDAIDQVPHADAADHEALKELQRTVGDVEDDIRFFKAMISVWESTENGEIFSLFIAGCVI